METLSKKELAQITGGNLEDWCASIKTIIGNPDNPLPEDGTMDKVEELYEKYCKK